MNNTHDITMTLLKGLAQVNARCGTEQKERILGLMCKELADSDQEYHEARSAEGWRAFLEGSDE